MLPFAAFYSTMVFDTDFITPTIAIRNAIIICEFGIRIISPNISYCIELNIVGGILSLP